MGVLGEPLLQYSGGRLDDVAQRDAAYRAELEQISRSAPAAAAAPLGGQQGPTAEEQASRVKAVRAAVQHCWGGYKAVAWGSDNLVPIAGRGTSGGFGIAITLVDSLDTLWMAGLHEDFEQAVNWCSENLPARLAHLSGGTSAFETTIRALG
jgi:hypothetical protein